MSGAFGDRTSRETGGILGDGKLTTKSMTRNCTRGSGVWTTVTNTRAQPESTKLIRPLLRKLKKCRDPDRADLVALQKARREMAAQKEPRRPKAEGDGATLGGDAVVVGGNNAREAKRRKVAEGDDVFGPALG